MKGTVKFYNPMKRFGFILGEDGKEYFVHISGLNEGVMLNENDTVTFDVEEGDKGPKAVNVSKSAAGEEPAQDSAEDEAPEEDSEENSEEEDFEEDSEDEDFEE